LKVYFACKQAQPNLTKPSFLGSSKTSHPKYFLLLQSQPPPILFYFFAKKENPLKVVVSYDSPFEKI